MRVKVFFLLFIINVFNGFVFDTKLDSLLSVLDQAISLSQSYTSIRAGQISRLKEHLNRDSLSYEERYRLNSELYGRYRSFLCDSAIYYLSSNIKLADSHNDGIRKSSSQVALSYLLASSGMYMEAVDMLKQIERKYLGKEELIDYYNACDRVYGEAGFYTQAEDIGKMYTAQSELYKDSLYALLDPHSELFMNLKETSYRDKGDLDKALAVNNERLLKAETDSQEYALIMYNRALLYREAENRDAYMICLALSAITDVRLATKDHASLWMLAQALLDAGDLEHSYQYMNFSWSETQLYNARLRVWQSMDDLSLIGDTYRMMLQDRNAQLKFYIICVSLLSVVVLLALLFIYKQLKKLAVARENLLKANEKLNLLNAELKQINEDLQSTNEELAESNKIKEEYIARFLRLCSTYITQLDNFRRLVNKKISSNQVAELFKLTRSDTVQEEALRELYANFDSAFLHLFPNFVEQFNELLQENERIVPKSDEQLNTELRIFALIRLGITDSSQIAEFLRYSVNTIYNYRAKVKNKARVSREDFENLVCRIR